MVVHPDHHGDEDDCIVEKVKLDARKIELQDAARYGLAEQVVMKDILPNQQKMFDVVPELDDQCDRPPGACSACKPFQKNPDSDQHYQGIAIVKYLRLNQPGIP